MTRTLRRLASWARPPESVSMTFSLRARTLSIEILRLGELDAPFGHLGRFAHHLGDVQQGLRRDAAAQQAGAAEPRVGLDDGDFQPQVGGQERGRITARPAAEDNNLRVHNALASLERPPTCKGVGGR